MTVASMVALCAEWRPKVPGTARFCAAATVRPAHVNEGWPMTYVKAEIAGQPDCRQPADSPGLPGRDERIAITRFDAGAPALLRAHLTRSVVLA